MQGKTKQKTLDMAGKAEEYEAMLKEAHHLLRRAIWVNWVFCRDADKLCDKIEKAVNDETMCGAVFHNEEDGGNNG